MMDIVFWVAVGLVLGWNFLPQPAWVKNLVGRAVSWVRGNG